MAVALPRTTRWPSLRHAARRSWTALVALGLRLNGNALPRQLEAGDRAELERTIFG
jgi:hypothetical protein